MLKSELIRPRLKIENDQVSVRGIPANYQNLALATGLIRLFGEQVGQSRAALAETLRTFEGDSLNYPVIRGLAAVLEQRAAFGNEPPVVPAELRAALFGRGPVATQADIFQPHSRAEVLAETAARLGLSSGEVEAAMFADLAEEQILLNPGEPISPADLIARYNLELARGVLYWAREMRLVVEGGYKEVFKYIKLFKLMYTIRPASVGYQITLHGPISPFVSSTIRYGVQFAKFLPALLLCPRWQMEAEVLPPGAGRSQPLRYQLDDSTSLRGHFKPGREFDSRLEADFAAEFETKYGGAKRKWQLAREDDLIIAGDSVMIPDFSLTHRKDGRRALLEIVGFWHPHYLQRKLDKVRQAGRSDLILLVYEDVNVAEGVFEAAAAGEVLKFQRKPILKDVLAAVDRSAMLPVAAGESLSLS
ncbi:MAG: hypothetical protein FOGNACKC_03432 [Anaerolineae bacterium]|nr:hypothetical protein [Anaerolineae bacterium]